MSAYQGEIAALLTAALWAFNTLAFSLAGRRVGSATVNHVRLWISLLFLLLIHFYLFDNFFPAGLTTPGFFWLSLSGLVGYVIGDALLFEALVRIGARLSMLVMTLTPVFSALLAWLFLFERLKAPQLAAITVTVGGIALVVGERKNNRGKQVIAGKDLLIGIMLAAGGALGQAAGLLFSKLGMAEGVHPVSANLVRTLPAVVIMAGWTTLAGRLGGEIKKLRDRRALAQITAGAAAGPVLGVIFALYAITRTHIGIASTLMSLSPLILIPLAHRFQGEHITRRAVWGTLTALAGAALLFFS